MALVRCDFFSEALGVGTSMTVLLPERTAGRVGLTGAAAGGGGAPVLYLLHGLSDDHTSWQRRTGIERYVAPLGLAVVMPAVFHSFYADEVHGHRYWTFLTEELPEVVGSFFRVSRRRQDTFVAGLSMGGYGALKWVLHQPDRFAAAATMSGGLDLVGLYTHRLEHRALLRRVFGGVPGPDNDLYDLLRRADPAAIPPVRLSCGTADPLIEVNRAFVTAARDAGIRLTADIGPGGHDWDYWDAQIERVLAWLPRPASG